VRSVRRPLADQGVERLQSRIGLHAAIVAAPCSTVTGSERMARSGSVAARMLEVAATTALAGLANVDTRVLDAASSTFQMHPSMPRSVACR
jgi:hypothetical protein